jgi:hypothetical protein
MWWLLLTGCHWIGDDDLNLRLGGTDTGCLEIDGWLDLDGDGYGDLETPSTGCYGPGRVDNSHDCDDTDPTISPDAAETWYDSVDQDCDGNDDDADADGWAREADCDDQDPDAWPGAPEVWHDGRVQDCSDPHAVPLALADAKLRGAEAYDAVGRQVALVGDLDGVAGSELAIGAPFLAVGARNPGGVYVVSAPDPGVSDLSSTATVLLGEEDFDQLGAAVAGAGDADGDGQADLFLGALHEGSAGEAAGAAYLIHGPLTGAPTRYVDDVATTRLLGENPGDWAGWAVAFAGPVNADGFDALLVGSLLAGDGGVEDAGAAYLVHAPGSGDLNLGSATARLRGVSLQDYAGTAVSGAGDVDGDGRDDVLIGATGTDHTGQIAGSVYVLSGPVTGEQSLSSARVRLDGPGAGSFAGTSVAAAGDVDGDGYDDVLIGATGFSDGADQPGAAFLLLGPLAQGGWLDAEAHAILIGVGDDDATGHSVAGVGDVDGDGRPDLAVGAPGHGAGGAVHLVLGAPSGTVDLDDHTVIQAENGDDEAGYSVAGGADLQADGSLDLVLGAPGHDAGFGRSGSIYVLFGGS